MDAPRIQPLNLRDESFECVLGWGTVEDLEYQVRVAWILLWLSLGHRPGTMSIHEADLGRLMGRNYPQEAGEQSLKSLEIAELIHVSHINEHTWTFYLVDPITLRNDLDLLAETRQLFEADQVVARDQDIESEPLATVKAGQSAPADWRRSDECVRLICATKMDDQAKVAWLLEWNSAGHLKGKRTTHTKALGKLMGAAESGQAAAGRRALSALRKANRIRMIEEYGGTRTFFLLDPMEQKQASTLRLAQPNLQPELFESPAEEGDTTDEGARPGTSAHEPEGTRAHLAQPPEPSPIEAIQISEGATPGKRALGPCNTDNTTTFTNDSPREERAASQSQDKGEGASPGTSAHLISRPLPTREEQLAKRDAQRLAKRAADDRVPPTLEDALQEFLRKGNRSYVELLKHCQQQIRETVAHPGLYEGVIVRTARAAAGNDAVARDLAALLDIIKKKFGPNPSLSEQRSKYFATSVRRMLRKHGITEE